MTRASRASVNRRIVLVLGTSSRRWRGGWILALMRPTGAVATAITNLRVAGPAVPLAPVLDEATPQRRRVSVMDPE